MKKSIFKIYISCIVMFLIYSNFFAQTAVHESLNENKLIINGQNNFVYVSSSKDKKIKNNNSDIAQSQVFQDKSYKMESTNSLVLDNLRLDDFKPFPKFITKQPNSNNNIETFDYEHWDGELFIKGSLLFNPRGSKIGYTIYDISKMQYGRVSYTTECDFDGGSRHQGLLNNNINGGSAFYSYCSTNIYKTYLKVEDYSDYKFYQYPYNDGKWHEISPSKIIKLPDPDSEIEIEVESKIYTYKYFRDASGRTKTFFINSNKDNKIVTCAKVKGAHNSLDYVYTTTYNNSSISNARLINVNNIIKNYAEYAGIANKKEETRWDVVDVNYMNDGKILLTIDVKIYTGRLLKDLPIEFSEKTQLGILLNSDLSFIKAQRLVESDLTIVGSSNNNIYKIINSGARVVCYDKDLNVKWFKVYGVENKKNVGHVSYCKEINNNVYIMGTASNKYHIGKQDPISWKINGTNGNIIAEDVMKLATSINVCQGFLFNDDSLYLVVLPIVDVNNIDNNNQILKKVNFKID